MTAASTAEFRKVRVEDMDECINTMKQPRWYVKLSESISGPECNERHFFIARMASMPAGAMPLGFVYFAAAKYLGYTAYCKWAIEPQLDWPGPERSGPPPVWIAGGARTLIGVVIGAIVGIGFWSIQYFSSHDSIANLIFFSALVPIRVFEWWLLLRWIYRGSRRSRSAIVALICCGIVVSFLLDGLGIVAAFVLPGGAWVC